jgi:tyrosyl-tRNA synthetase
MTVDEQLGYLTRGCVDVFRPEELRAKLARSAATGRPLTVKVGFDPTAPDLHLGHTVLVRKMKHFQDLGHRVIFLIGAFTGLIGDPTGRSKTRPPLTEEEIEANAETYKAQVFTLLDREKTVVDFNSRWLATMTSFDWVKLTARYNVAKMLERRDFRQRFEQGQPIAMHEFLYPLAQAYDSVVLEADVELGGTDQLFNLNVGRDLMPSFGLEAQVVMTVPLLVGLDGIEKMSKSLGNYVGVAEPAEVVVEKIVEQFRGSDEVMWSYFTLLTDRTLADIEELKARFARGEATATELRYELAESVARDFQGPEAAGRAVAQVRRRHALRRAGRRAGVEDAGSGDGTGDGEALPSADLEIGEEPVNLSRVIADLKFAPSASEATRQIRAGGVRIDGERVGEVRWTPPRPGAYTLTVGSRKVAVLRVRGDAAGHPGRG